jgi:hypothetical protein
LIKAKVKSNRFVCWGSCLTRNLPISPTYRVGSCATFEDTRIDYGEPRFITFGFLEGRMVVIAHTPRKDKTRIISMRKANNREQKTYQERLEKT